jgi:hypothetical protein
MFYVIIYYVGRGLVFVTVLVCTSHVLGPDCCCSVSKPSIHCSF